MTIEWLTDTEQVVERAWDQGSSLGWLALAAPETTTDGTSATSDFIASTGTIDRMGDSVDQQTWKLARYRQNPVIMADHAVPVIGVAKRVGITEADGAKQLRMSVTWDPNPVNVTAAIISEQHRTGFRRAVSVGFIPGEIVNRADLPADHPLYVDSKSTARWQAGYLFRHPQLLEVSSVAVPANPEALQLGLDIAGAEDSGPAWRRALNASVGKDLRERLLELLRTDKEARAVLSAIYLSAPTNSGGLAHLWSK